MSKLNSIPPPPLKKHRETQNLLSHKVLYVSINDLTHVQAYQQVLPTLLL